MTRFPTDLPPGEGPVDPGRDLPVEILGTIAALRALLAHKQRQLQALHRLTESLHACQGVDRAVEQVLSTCVEALNATSGSILLHSDDRDRLVFRYVIGEVRQRLTGMEMPAGDGIAGSVFRTGRSALAPDVAAEARHYAEIDRLTAHRTRDLIAAPLKTMRGQTVGVIEVLNSRRGGFQPEDLELLEIMSGPAASAIETARLHGEMIRAELEKKRFYAEVIRCVTHGRLRLADREEIPEHGSPVLEVSLAEPDGYAALRRGVRALAAEAGLTEQETDDLVLAAGEAATNAIKHGHGGTARVYGGAEVLAIRITDQGPGIRPENLPAAVLQPGFSTRISLGMGYTLLLELSDRLWLATGPSGTILQVEKWLRSRPDDPLEQVLERWARQSDPDA